MDPSASASSSRRTLSPDPPAPPSLAYQGDTDEAGPTQLQLSLLSRGDWGTSASPSGSSRQDDGDEGSEGAGSSSAGWQELSDSDRPASRPPLFPLRRRQDQHHHHHHHHSSSSSASPPSSPRSPTPPSPPQDPDPRDWSYRTNLIDPPSPPSPHTTSSSSYDSSDDDSDESEWSTTTSQYVAEQEAQLREAFEQLELAFKCILCPVLGKMLGRWGAYWAFKRYTAHGGLTLRFFGLSWVPETKIPSWLAVLFLPMSAGGGGE